MNPSSMDKLQSFERGDSREGSLDTDVVLLSRDAGRLDDSQLHMAFPQLFPYYQ